MAVVQLAQLMHLSRTDAVTVLDQGRLVGLITSSDLIAMLAGEPPHRPAVHPDVDPGCEAGIGQ